MADENLTKTIRELRGEHFFIPAYQRGYRWTEQEVNDLLDDIYEFDTGNNNLQYCLQPLIVKKDQDGRYEVVDGQQRLTTIYIFLKIVYSTTKKEPYTLEYATRSEKSQKFLEKLGPDYDGSINNEYIDYYHMTTAYNTIKKWIDDKVKQGKNKTKASIENRMFDKIVENTFFIWYEMPDNENPVELFSRVNVGKIRLSNAELIKALLFNINNFKEIDEKYADRRQQELALSWDRIERGLQNESFWYFLNDETNTYKTRIDFLFKLLLDSNQKLTAAKKNIQQNNEYNTFLIYYVAYKQAEDKSAFVLEIWGEIEGLYERFQEWYADLDKYHIIGFLIASGVSIKDIFKWTDGKRKSETISVLIDKTKDKVPGAIKEVIPRAIEKEKAKTANGGKPKPNETEEKEPSLIEMVSKITYDSDKKLLRQLFLLFNIATLYCKNDKQYRFPFDLYKKEKWDIEHIHATADESDFPDGNIGNLTLLNSYINRSYKNSPFNVKRIIIRECDSKGKFIPICTKNVFQKQYSDTIDSMDDWNEDDKRDYITKLSATLLSFWMERKESNE